MHDLDETYETVMENNDKHEDNDANKNENKWNNKSQQNMKGL